MRTTMYMNQFTQIDHAYINSKGCVVGGSFNLSCKVSGPVEDKEQVVIDFSACKKLIKEYIDDDGVGFDHKLWIIEGISQYYTLSHNKLTTPALQVESSVNDCFKYIPNVKGASNYMEAAREAMEQYLNVLLSEKYAGACVEVFLDEEFLINPDMMGHGNEVLNPIRYVHGLRNSSSYGCQNIAHGHLSYYTGAPLKNESYVFVYAENIVNDSEAQMIVKYKSQRGEMKMVLDKMEHNVLVFDRETTIENLANSFVFNDVKFISEGLAKGAYRTR